MIKCQKHEISVTGCSLWMDQGPEEVCSLCPSQSTHPIASFWRERLGITETISLEEVKQKFKEWRDSKRTCERCLPDRELSRFCPVRSICLEIKEEEEVKKDGGEIDLGSGSYENTGIEEAGLG